MNPPAPWADELPARHAHALATLRPVLAPIVHWPTRRLFGCEVDVRAPAVGSRPELRALAARVGRTQETNRAARRCAADVADRVPGVLSFDLYPDELFDEDLYAVSTPLAPHASRIVFELTGTPVLSGIRDLDARLGALRSVGYRFALEHVGVGLGLEHLCRIVRPTFVKMDYGLLEGVPSGPVRDRILRRLLRLTREVGARPIVEGVGPAVGDGRRRRHALQRLGYDLQQSRLLPGRARVVR